MGLTDSEALNALIIAAIVICYALGFIAGQQR